MGFGVEKDANQTRHRPFITLSEVDRFPSFTFGTLTKLSYLSTW